MQKSKAMIIVIIMMVLIGVGVFILVRGTRSDGCWSSKWNHEVTVKNGVVESRESITDFTVDKKDEYSLALSWYMNSDTSSDEVGSRCFGFITGCVITNPAGEVAFSTAAGEVYQDMKISLEKGNYRITFTYMNDEEEYISYAKKYLCGELMAETWAKDLDFGSLPENGNWKIDYEMKVSDMTGSTTRILAGILIILTGVCISVIMMAAFSNNKKVEMPQYDERQELGRGQGFRYGFFSILIFCGGVLIFDWLDIIPGQNQSILYATGLFAGIIVYAGYCIWHECYFALNQKTMAAIIFIAVIGLFNLALGITAIVNGSMIKDGRFEPRFLNLICGLMMLCIFVIMLIKKAYDKKHDNLEDEE